MISCMCVQNFRAVPPAEKRLIEDFVTNNLKTGKGATPPVDMTLQDALDNLLPCLRMSLQSDKN